MRRKLIDQLVSNADNSLNDQLFLNNKLLSDFICQLISEEVKEIGGDEEKIRQSTSPWLDDLCNVINQLKDDQIVPNYFLLHILSAILNLNVYHPDLHSSYFSTFCHFVTKRFLFPLLNYFYHF